MAKKKITYQEAYKELETILSDIQNDSISIDKLAIKVKRSKELLNICRTQLRAYQEEIEDLSSD